MMMAKAMQAGQNTSRKEEEQWRRAPTNFNVPMYALFAIVFMNGIKVITIHDFDCARFDNGISPMLLHRTIESAWYIYEHSATYKSERTLREHVFWIMPAYSLT